MSCEVVPLFCSVCPVFVCISPSLIRAPVAQEGWAAALINFQSVLDVEARLVEAALLHASVLTSMELAALIARRSDVRADDYVFTCMCLLTEHLTKH